MEAGGCACSQKQFGGGRRKTRRAIRKRSKTRRLHIICGVGRSRVDAAKYSCNLARKLKRK